MASDVGGVAADQLRSFIDRIERLNQEKADLAEDIRQVFAEAKGSGFDVKVMRKIIADRKKGEADVNEFESLLALYRRATGWDDTALGAAAAPAADDDEVDDTVSAAA